MRLLLEELGVLYARIDQQVKAFQLKTGLRCPHRCGACCSSAEVFASVLEMLPAAHEIICRGATAHWLERIEAEQVGGICVFYERQPAPDAPGHCGFYAFRPSICRLFGFATVRNRNGKRELSVCRRVKDADPPAVALARLHQAEAPCFSETCTEISALDMATGARLMPINEALRRAILRLGLSMQLSQSESLGIISAA